MEKNRIFFQKPNHDLFYSMGLTSVDMHFHSRYSDSFTRIRTVIKKAAKMKMGVSITDHNEIEGAIKAFGNDSGVMVVPGIEVSCMEGPHILLYFYGTGELQEFYEKHIKPKKQGNPYMAINMKVTELIEAAKDFNCIRCAAHPFGYSLTNVGLSKSVKKKYIHEAVFNDIDALEVINGGMNRWLNRKAEKKTMELEKCFTSGSDGHTIFELGKAVTCSYAGDLDCFLTNILKKKNFVIGKEVKLTPKLLHGTNVVGKHMRYAVPSIKLQYQINKGRVKNFPNKIKNGTIIIKDKIKNMRNGNNTHP